MHENHETQSKQYLMKTVGWAKLSNCSFKAHFQVLLLQSDVELFWGNPAVGPWLDFTLLCSYHYSECVWINIVSQHLCYPEGTWKCCNYCLISDSRVSISLINWSKNWFAFVLWWAAGHPPCFRAGGGCGTPPPTNANANAQEEANLKRGRTFIEQIIDPRVSRRALVLVYCSVALSLPAFWSSLFSNGC